MDYPSWIGNIHRQARPTAAVPDGRLTIAALQMVDAYLADQERLERLDLSAIES